ncbi:MAG: transcriptional regulator [Firmicutes bacterium HGW-Firmicutes-2]|nr:MAG: transcriptional regulator [Firmicutes bacterium HGW-Firmicutes-2]
MLDKNEIMKYRMMNKFFSGFSDYSRMVIFGLLSEGDKTVSELVEETGFSQSKISNHLKCLRDTNLVDTIQNGKFVIYSIKDEKIKKILELADECITKQTQEQYNCLKY